MSPKMDDTAVPFQLPRKELNKLNEHSSALSPKVTLLVCVFELCVCVCVCV